MIGNSRWHWAEREPSGWRIEHSAPDPSRLSGASLVWAAVGRTPADPALTVARRVLLADVPLQGCPEWLGVDRALGAWAAWTRSQRLGMDLSSGLLLVDAGTVLSLTLLNPAGAFAGGQLIPGLQLQLASMASGTAALERPSGRICPTDMFPRTTAEAMVRGVLQSMVGAVKEAQLRSGASLWLCGGDAVLLAEALGSKAAIRLDPDLVVKGLIDLMT